VWVLSFVQPSHPLPKLLLASFRPGDIKELDPQNSAVGASGEPRRTFREPMHSLAGDRPDCSVQNAVAGDGVQRCGVLLPDLPVVRKRPIDQLLSCFERHR
jgi:hypothetical protein